MAVELTKVQVEEVRSKSHDFSLNIGEQVQRKVLDADKALLKVETNQDEIKIKPNSGNFKCLSEEVNKLKIGDEINTNEAVAIVKDKYEQTDTKKIPYMVKTEFLVTDVVTKSSKKAVLHTYLTQNSFMIQGNGKDIFFNSIMKKFMQEIMEKKGQEIRFINKVLLSKVQNVNTNQWKRKQVIKHDKCDLCSRTFANKQGVNIHKKRVHGNDLVKKPVVRTLSSLKLNSLKRSDSVGSVGDGSRPTSPSPKKIHMEKKQEEPKKVQEEMEQSGKSIERESDQKVDVSIQCDGFPQNPSRESQLEIDLKIARDEIGELMQEKKQLKAHNTRKHAGYEALYNEILVEKQRMSVEMIKLQSEKDLLQAKVTSLENSVNENQVDECVANIRCDGNCEHIDCNRKQAQRLKELKDQGGKRQSPGEQASFTVKINCPQCNFTCKQKNDLNEHVKRNHNNFPSCPFCLIGFYNQPSLRRHIEEYHNENTQIIRERKLSA